MQTRIYRVEDKDETRLIEAGSAAGALRYCAEHRWEVEIATPKEIARLMAQNVRVEDATSEEASE